MSEDFAQWERELTEKVCFFCRATDVPLVVFRYVERTPIYCCPSHLNGRPHAHLNRFGD